MGYLPYAMRPAPSQVWMSGFDSFDSSSVCMRVPPVSGRFAENANSARSRRRSSFAVSAMRNDGVPNKS